MSDEMSALEFIMWFILIPPMVILAYVLAFVWIGIFIKIMEKICK
jgi:hypothetical protein